MAKEQKTKSDTIREALAKWPDLTTGEIADKLKAQGHDVTMPYVSSVKSLDAKKAKTKRKRQASSRRVKGGRSRRVVSMTALRKTRELAKELGGVNQLRLLLDLLEELKG